MNNLSYLEFTAQTPITLKAGCAGGLPLVFTRTAYQGSGRKRLQFRQGISSIKSKLGSLATGRSAKSRRSQQSILNLPSILQQAIPSVGTSQSSTSESQKSRPAHWANDSGTLFRNPWPESAAPPTWNEFAWPVAWKKPVTDKARRIAVVRPEFDREDLDPNTLQTTWLGHASVLLQIPIGFRRRAFNVLTDPVFSLRAGPTQVTGIKRALDPPCVIHDLPDIDAVAISHNHYDHLDHGSIMQIYQLFPNAIYLVPLGVGKWLAQSGIPSSSIRELDWWKSHELPTSTLLTEKPDADDHGLLRFTCVPAQHNSGRTPGDVARSLWAGWVFEHFENSASRTSCAYFAGDTGYRRFSSSKEVCPIYKEIGQTFGPIDLAFLPIWRGGSLGFVSYTGFALDHDSLFIAHHSTPSDAVDMHKDLKSRCSVAIHYATFVGSADETLEATSQLAQACQKADISNDLSDPQAKNRFGCLDIGQSFYVACAPKTVE